MTHSHAHAELESRLAALETRIAQIRQAMQTDSDQAKVEDASKLADLEHRHAALAARLTALRDEGFASGLRAELSLMLDDLATAVDDVVSWVDAGSHGHRP